MPFNHPVAPVALSPDELKDLFIKSLQAAGAAVVELGNKETEAYIASIRPEVLDFNKPEIRGKYPPSCSLEQLEKIEYALFQGNIGVAENGAIWLEEKDFPHRILPFITRRLILRLSAEQIVADMQEAYRRIRLNDGFGVFISGPSKTADIEQSLVYGAHGAKEATVIIN
jgi:L-lactate dehydrogenase complex protein LldG